MTDAHEEVARLLFAEHAHSRQPPMTEQQPSVGRIVHVADHKGECQAAIVTEVATPEIVSVMLFPARSSPHPINPVWYHETGEGKPAPTTWHWPERISGPSTATA